MNDGIQKLSKAAQSVQDALSRKGLALTVVELSDSTRTAEEAARAIGCTVAQIVKALVFRTKSTARPILVLASGPNRVNERSIAERVGEPIVKADAQFVRDATGFAIGGIPPIGHRQPLETFIDEDLTAHREVWAAAGTPHAVFRLAGDDLQALTNGTVISLR
ncbi:MAG TPA: YbaK/EbsC family protein [Polyangiaceae bacterium]|nr:YbaK/EbsC family protein [Polyangiaceae bacterium]